MFIGESARHEKVFSHNSEVIATVESGLLGVSVRVRVVIRIRVVIRVVIRIVSVITVGIEDTQV